MPTQTETLNKFKKMGRDAGKKLATATGDAIKTSADRSYQEGYRDGAKAEREEVLAIVRDAAGRLETLNAEGSTVMRSVERRIKARET